MQNSKLTKNKEVRQIKSKVRNMLIVCFDIKGAVNKEFILAGQNSILHTAMTFHGNCVKMCKVSASNFGNK
jgi:hypothetical protein